MTFCVEYFFSLVHIEYNETVEIVVSSASPPESITLLQILQPRVLVVHCSMVQYQVQQRHDDFLMMCA
jgi:hypothetical protein